MCEKWVRETPDGFLFDAKVHRLLSRHATKVDALPKDLQEQVELNDRENVILTPGLGGGSCGSLPPKPWLPWRGRANSAHSSCR